MQSQQRAQSELLRLFGRLVSLCLILIILAVMGVKYFSTVPQVAGRSVELAHTRFLHVLAMVHAQWLSLGKPQQLTLEWQALTEVAPTAVRTEVKVNVLGWPQPEQRDAQGCQDLWWQLMGQPLSQQSLSAEFYPKDGSCRYSAANGESIGYQLDSGRVVFLMEN